MGGSDSATRSCQGFRAILQGVMGKVNGSWDWEGQCMHGECIEKKLHLGKYRVVEVIGERYSGWWKLKGELWRELGYGETCAWRAARDGAEGKT